MVEIGTRLQWWGLRPRPRGISRAVDPETLRMMISKIEWRGRLWRDPRISPADALEQTWRGIWDNPGYRRVDAKERGFVFFGLAQGDTTRVNLIGVLPEYRKQGVARGLLALCPTTYMIAGTYEDNTAACAFYASLGWKVIKREVITNP